MVSPWKWRTDEQLHLTDARHIRANCHFFHPQVSQFSVLLTEVQQTVDYVLSVWRNNEASIESALGSVEEGVALWCLQTIHLFTVSLVSLCLIHFSHSNGSIQYRKVQRGTWTDFFSLQRGERYTMIPWELPGTMWFVAEGTTMACIVSFL